MADLGELSARITADIQEFERQMDSATESVDDFGKTGEDSGKKASKGFSGAERATKALSRATKAGAVAIAAAGAAFVKMTADAMKAQDQHAKLARAMGVTNEELAVLERAADLSGISMGELESNMRRFTRRLSEAGEGSGQAADAFEKLGISADEIVDLSMEDQLVALGEALEGVENRTEKAAIAQDIFGRSGMQMINLLENAEGTFDRASEEVDTFGLALDEVDTDAIEAANDNISTLKEAAGAFATQMAATVAPSIRDATQGLIDFAASMVKAQTETMEYIRASNRVGTDQEQTYDRLLDLERQRQSELDRFGNLMTRQQNDEQHLHDNRMAILDEQIRAERDHVSQQERAAAMSEKWSEEANQRAAEEAEREAAAAADRAREQAQLEAWLERVNSAYAQTDEGRLEAIESQIAWFEQAQQEAKNTAHMFGPILEMLREQRDLLSGSGDEGGPEPDTGPDYGDQLEELQEFMMSEQELLQKRYAERWALLHNAIEDEEELRVMEQQLTEQHQAKLEEIERQAAERRKQLQMTVGTGMANNLVSIYSNLSQATEDNEKKLFEQQKNAAVASAVINGIQATVSSYRHGAQLGGPVVGAAFAATAAGATGTQIAAIRSQKFQGGGSSPAPPSSKEPEATTGSDGGTDRSLVVQGDFDSSELFTGEAVRQLMDRISEAQEDGYRVVMS